VPAALVAFVLLAAAAAFFLLGNDDDPDDTASGDETTTTAAEDETTTTAADDETTTTAGFDFPEEDFVHVKSAFLGEDGDTIDVSFETNFIPTSVEDGFAGPNHHIHFFWDVPGDGVDARAEAGTNGTPEPCFCWFAYGGSSPAVDPDLLSLTGRPEGATLICALVATPADDPDGGHRIADIDGDGEPDPGSGDCLDVSSLAEPGDTASN
jgi:hypothetical protein